MPLLRRPHDHHRDLRARPIPALPTINANHRAQDRHVVTRIPVLRRRRADFACRRFSTDRDDTRQNPPFRRRSKPSRAALNLHLDHERGVLLTNTTIDRVEARRAPPAQTVRASQNPIECAAPFGKPPQGVKDRTGVSSRGHSASSRGRWVAAR